jgi:hypothetical protein
VRKNLRGTVVESLMKGEEHAFAACLLWLAHVFSRITAVLGGPFLKVRVTHAF